MQKNSFLYLLCVGGLVSGCASTPTALNMNSMKQSNPSSIVISKREKPSFLAVTALNVQFGLLGAAAQASSGNKMVNENGVEDPAIYIANEIAQSLGKNLASENIQNSSIVAKTTNVKALAEQYQGADLLIDVQTTNWQSVYYKSDWNNYRVNYAATFRLIDTKNKVLLAEAKCSEIQDDKNNSPSYDELTANNAAILKAALKVHADACIEEFKAKALGISAS